MKLFCLPVPFLWLSKLSPLYHCVLHLYDDLFCNKISDADYISVLSMEEVVHTDGFYCVKVWTMVDFSWALKARYFSSLLFFPPKTPQGV